MTTQDVANRLVELCRTGQSRQAKAELYHPDIVSMEPEGTPNWKVQGIEAVNAKADQWESMVEEFHSANVSDPIVTGNHFSVSMENECTFKGRGRQWIKEICVYEVQEGKVVKEQFFYNWQ